MHKLGKIPLLNVDGAKRQIFFPPARFADATDSANVDGAKKLSTRSTFAGGPDSALATLPSRLQNQAGSAEAADSTHGDSAHADQAGLAEAADSTDADKAGCVEASDAGNADKAGFDEAAGAAVADKTGFVSVADATCESRWGTASLSSVVSQRLS